MTRPSARAAGLGERVDRIQGAAHHAFECGARDVIALGLGVETDQRPDPGEVDDTP